MLRVSHLRKVVKPRAPCPDPAIALLGTEVGAPVSAGLTVNVLNGTVAATGTGYDFTKAVLSVTTKEQCPLASEMTFSISGTGPIPAINVYEPSTNSSLLGVLGTGVTYAGFGTSTSYWAIQAVQLGIPAGVSYELKCSIADTWVGVWLNGNRVAREAVTPGHLATTLPWNVVVGRYFTETYTGHVDSVSLANGALPDIDVL